jgi:excisionase family DNA binding protein
MFLTRDELAEQLRVTSRTLWEWGKQRAGPPVTRIGGRVLYERDAVQAWLKSKQTRAA